jgi:hypothetical protein
MSNQLNQYILKLSKLSEDSKNPKLLWEEMQILSKKAFDLQEKIMLELDKIEQTETDVTKIQAAFAAREDIWDIMAQIAERELALKEKTYHKETPEERAKRHQDVLSYSETCACGHHHGDCNCNHDKHDTCAHGGKKCCKM